MSSSLSQYYDFSQHEKEHYDKGVDASYGAIIVTKAYDEILLIAGSGVQRGDHYWGFPKGHREDEETNVQAAIREIKEETSIETEEADFLLNEKGDDLKTFVVEFPWSSHMDLAKLHIYNVLKKQKANPGEKHRPHINKAGKYKRRIELYLVPMPKDKFTPKPHQDDSVQTAEWVSWKEAEKRMRESKSNHLQMLHEAFNYLKSLKRIPKDKKLPPITKEVTKQISDKMKQENKLMSAPLKDWPVEKQPQGWEEKIAALESGNVDNVSDNIQTVQKKPVDDTSTNVEKVKLDNGEEIIIEDDDAEESEEAKTGGGSLDDMHLFWMWAFILLGLLLIIYFVHHTWSDLASQKTT